MNTSENELRNALLKLASYQHHKQYVHGKHGPDTFDCAGLVWFLYHEILHLDLYDQGYGLSTTTKIMTSKYGIITLYPKPCTKGNLDQINKGDILFFHRQSLADSEPKETNKYPGHCGLYLGNNTFIHCVKSQGKVIISNFHHTPYWQNILVASKNIFTDEQTYKKVKQYKTPSKR